MAQRNDNDNSDLLILSDDDSSFDTLVMDNNINNVESIGSDNELITFEDDMNLDLWKNPEVEQNSKNEWLDIDLSSFGNDFSNEKQVEVVSELNNDFNFDLSSDSIDTPEVEKSDILPTNIMLDSTDNVWTMVSILDKAIHELTTRSEVIISEIDTEEKHISELKEKIVNLEWQVVVSEKLVSELTDEKTMISKNIKSLDKMKLIEHAAQKETKTK